MNVFTNSNCFYILCVRSLHDMGRGNWPLIAREGSSDLDTCLWLAEDSRNCLATWQHNYNMTSLWAVKNPSQGDTNALIMNTGKWYIDTHTWVMWAIRVTLISFLHLNFLIGVICPVIKPALITSSLSYIAVFYFLSLFVCLLSVSLGVPVCCGLMFDWKFTH